MATRTEIIHLVSLIQYLPNSPITEKTIGGVADMFVDDLQDLPVETLESAFRQYRSTATFFPTPGRIREIAMDLQMLAMGVPTPAEAWGMVLTAVHSVTTVLCEEASAIREFAEMKEKAHDGPGYLLYSNKYTAHRRTCEICVQGGLREVYGHSAVSETVKLLGGRDVIITDNPTADRARFIDAYREIVSRERTKTSMLPTVKEYVEQKRDNLLAGNQMKQLAKGLSK